MSLPAREFLPSAKESHQFNTDAAAEPQDSCGLPVPPPDPYMADLLSDGHLFAPTDSAGRPIVPGYDIIDELGRGAMGVVYKARQVGLNRVVALKMILPARGSGSTGRQLFQAEAEAVARLQHPHIVQIYEIGEYAGAPFFSLEFCPGGSLADRLAGKPLAAREGAELVETLAGAIEAAHVRGLIHRDLKPANVLIGAGGLLKVTDFGLAKKLDETGDPWNGAILGTPSYMAPEQADGKDNLISPATDVYALGAILYECLTGRPPFLAASVWDVLEQMRTQEPMPPRHLEPRVPPDLQTICLKCLHKEPAKRYASAQDLADDLGRFLRDEPIRARPVPVWERAAKWARRRPTTALLVLALTLAVLTSSVGGWFFGLYTVLQNAVLRQQDQALQDANEQYRKALDALADASRTPSPEDADHHLLKAEGFLKSALTALQAEGVEAPDLWDKITERIAQVRKDHEKLERRLKLRPVLAQLQQDRHEILFREIRLTGLDPAGTQEQVRRLASQALAPFGIRAERSPASAVAALARVCELAEPEQHKQVAETCYELLLAWAEAEQDARRALRLLDLASAVGKAERVPVPQAYHLRRARYLSQAGEKAEAARREKRAAAIKPDTALDHFLSALEHYRRATPEETEKAARACSLALHAQPRHFWAQYLLALCQMKCRRWAEAEASLTVCLGARPNFFWAVMLRGTVHAELARRRGPATTDPLARGEVEAAEADFSRALTLAEDPLSRYAALTNRATYRAQQRRWQAAVADLEAAIKLRPRDATAWLNLYATRARGHLEQKDLAAAQDALEQAISRMSPKSDNVRLANALVELGVLKQRAGRPTEALADFSTALEIQPDYPLAHRQRADVLFKLHRYAEAGKALDNFLAHGKPAFEVYLARGLIHSQLREYELAVDAYTGALILKKDKIDLARTAPRLVAEARTQRGWAYLRLKSPQMALADFNEALKLRPEHVFSLGGRGHAKVLLGQVTEAIQDAEAALRRSADGEQELLVAGIYARAAEFLNLQRKTNRERADAARYEERSADLVCKALLRIPEEERVVWWRKRVQAETTLKVIHRHPRVLRLIGGAVRN